MRQNDEYELRGLARQIDLERKLSTRPCISRGKQLDNLDWHTINVTQTAQIVDPVSGNFFFVPGYSIVGGPDVVQQ